MRLKNASITAANIEVRLNKVALDCMVSPRYASALNALYGDQGFEFILVQDLVPPRSYTFPVLLCHSEVFLDRPLMSESILLRTVWK